jgi:hypothetical protein
MIGADELVTLAGDALEAGFDGSSIRRLASLDQPTGWETDQLVPAFMAETGMKGISRAEASVRVALELARRILLEGLDPLIYLKDLEVIWIEADYPAEIQDVATLHDQMESGLMVRPEAKSREYVRGVLLEFVTASDVQT